MISYILYRAASVLVRILPRGIATWIAAAIAFLFYLARPTIRRNVRTNYEKLGIPARSTFPVFRNFSRAVTDFLGLAFMNGEQLRARCAIRGIENLDGTLKRGSGAILFAPHLGPWEVAGACLASHGYRMHTIALEHPSAPVTRFFSKERKEWGFYDYPARSLAAGLVRAVMRGEVVVLLIDRNFSNRGIRLHFLGHDLLLPDGHAMLSLRTGAPLVPCCCYYTASGNIEVLIGEPLPTHGEGAPDIANACLARIEEFIRAHPDQWFAFDHLWQETSDV
jgi:lauroyl/myristoyl acyltransferase